MKIRRKNPNVRPDSDYQDTAVCWWHSSWASCWCFLIAWSAHLTGEHVHVSKGDGGPSPHLSLWHALHATKLW